MTSIKSNAFCTALDSLQKRTNTTFDFSLELQYFESFSLLEDMTNVPFLESLIMNRLIINTDERNFCMEILNW